MHAAERGYGAETLGIGEVDGLAFDDSRLAIASAVTYRPEAEAPRASGRSTRRLRRRDEFFGDPEEVAPPPSRRCRRVSDESWRQALAFAGVPVCPVCRAQNPLSSSFCGRCQHPAAPPAPPSSAALAALPRRRAWPLRLAGLALTAAAAGAAGLIWGHAAVDLIW